MSNQVNALRQTIKQQTDKVSQKKRFALFSQPPPLFLGDTQYLPISHPRDQQGKPKIQQKNITVSNVKKGSHPSTLFSQTGYITTGDSFLDSSRRAIIQQNTKRRTGMSADKQKFKPGFYGKTIMHAPYEWMPRNSPKRDPRAYKTQDGKVISQPSNVLNNTHSKIGYTYFKDPSYSNQPYDTQKRLDNQQRTKHRLILKQINQKSNGRNFCGMDHGNKPFNNSRNVLSGDEQMRKIFIKQRPRSITNHDSKFKCSTPGYGHPIGKFPQYKQDPLRFPVRKQQGQKKQRYKLNHVQVLSRPTPSISLLPGNNLKYKK